MAAWALGGIKGSFKVSGWKYFRIFAAALLQEKWNEQRLYRGGRQPEQRGGRAGVRHLHDIYSPVAVDTRYLLRLLDI